VVVENKSNFYDGIFLEKQNKNSRHGLARPRKREWWKFRHKLWKPW
jgi:hypothetical protein